MSVRFKARSDCPTMDVLIKERIDSGMTITERCQEKNIKESQYYYWLKTLHEEEAGVRKAEQQEPPFVEFPSILIFFDNSHFLWLSFKKMWITFSS